MFTTNARVAPDIRPLGQQLLSVRRVRVAVVCVLETLLRGVSQNTPYGDPYAALDRVFPFVKSLILSADAEGRAEIKSFLYTQFKSHTSWSNRLNLCGADMYRDRSHGVLLGLVLSRLDDTQIQRLSEKERRDVNRFLPQYRDNGYPENSFSILADVVTTQSWSYEKKARVLMALSCVPESLRAFLVAPVRVLLAYDSPHTCSGLSLLLKCHDEATIRELSEILDVVFKAEDANILESLHYMQRPTVQEALHMGRFLTCLGSESSESQLILNALRRVDWSSRFRFVSLALPLLDLLPDHGKTLFVTRYSCLNEPLFEMFAAGLTDLLAVSSMSSALPLYYDAFHRSPRGARDSVLFLKKYPTYSTEVALQSIFDLGTECRLVDALFCLHAFVSAQAVVGVDSFGMGMSWYEEQESYGFTKTEAPLLFLGPFAIDPDLFLEQIDMFIDRGVCGWNADDIKEILYADVQEICEEDSPLSLDGIHRIAYCVLQGRLGGVNLLDG
jgi:hypothetical protein